MAQATQAAHPFLTKSARRRRRSTTRSNVRLEGFVLDEKAEAPFASYLNDEIDRSELETAVLELADSFGQISVHEIHLRNRFCIRASFWVGPVLPTSFRG